MRHTKLLGIMTYSIARPIAWLTVTAGSAWLVSRYRLWGVVASVLLGSVILYLAYHAWPVPIGEWDEDGEEIHYTAPILIAIWCFPIWLIVGVLTNFMKRGKFRP